MLDVQLVRVRLVLRLTGLGVRARARVSVRKPMGKTEAPGKPASLSRFVGEGPPEAHGGGLLRRSP